MIDTLLLFSSVRVLRRHGHSVVVFVPRTNRCKNLTHSLPSHSASSFSTRPVPHRRLRFSNTTTTPCKRIKTSIDCSFSYFIHGGVSMPVRNGAVFVPRSTAPTIRVRKEARDQFASASSTHSEESQQPERAPFCISQAPPNPRWAPKSPVGRPPSVVDRTKTVAGESSVLPLIVILFCLRKGTQTSSHFRSTAFYETIAPRVVELVYNYIIAACR